MHRKPALDFQDTHDADRERASGCRGSGRLVESSLQHLSLLQYVYPARVVGRVVLAVDVEQDAVKRLVVGGDRLGRQRVPELKLLPRIIPGQFRWQRLAGLDRLAAGDEHEKERYDVPQVGDPWYTNGALDPHRLRTHTSR